MVKLLPPFLVAILIGIVGFQVIHEGHNWGGDFALYIEQARAILNGEITDLFLMNEKAMIMSQYAVGPHLYPMGYPLFLAAILANFGLDFLLIKSFNVIFLSGAFIFFYLLSSKLLTRNWLALIAGSLVFLHPSLITFADNVLSDIPFLFLSLLAFYLFECERTVRNNILIGIAITLAYSVRDIGVFLFVVLVIKDVYTLSQNKWGVWSNFSNFLPYLIFAFGFLLISAFIPPGNENHWAMLWDSLSLDLILTNLSYYIQLFKEFFYLSSAYYLIPILILVILGMRKIIPLRRELVLYVFLVLGLLLIWPARQGIRFLFPIMPFIILFAICGIEVIKIAIDKKLRKYINALLLIASGYLFFLFVPDIQQHAKRNSNAVTTESAENLYYFVKNGIPPGKIIAFEKPRVLRLFTHRNAIFSTPGYFSQSEAEYIILHQYQYHESFEEYDKIYDSEEFLIYKK